MDKAFRTQRVTEETVQAFEVGDKVQGQDGRRGTVKGVSDEADAKVAEQEVFEETDGIITKTAGKVHVKWEGDAVGAKHEVPTDQLTLRVGQFEAPLPFEARKLRADPGLIKLLKEEEEAYTELFTEFS